MGVITVTDEFTSPIPPSRLFKALILDTQYLIPKLLPQVIKSIEVIEGDGRAGSIRQISFVEGTALKPIKNRIDEIDEELFIYNYTLIEGDALVGKLEKISYEAKFETAPDGGTISKMTIHYYTLDGASLTEEEIKGSKEKAIGMYKAVETYLLHDSAAYA